MNLKQNLRYLIVLCTCNPMLVMGAIGCASEQPAEEEAVTYYRDVAPIFVQHCVSCHQEGSIGPMVLDDVEVATDWASSIDHVTSERTMPPVLVTDDGSCGTFQGPNWLSESELATVHAWVSGGMVAGDPEDAPNFEVSPPVLESVDMTIDTPSFAPEIAGGESAAFDEYRCFHFENPHSAEVFLTGYHVTPGNAALVHHTTVYSVDFSAPSWIDGVTNGDLIGAYQAVESERDGWPCFGAAGDGVRHDNIPAIWAPGQGAVSYPEGVGLRLRPGQDFVVQVHYNLDSPEKIGQTDSTRVDFTLADQVTREAWFVAPDDFLLSSILEGFGMGEAESIPAGERAYQYSFEYSGVQALLDGGFDPATAGPFELLGIMPHMHEAGRRQWMSLRDTEGDVCAMEVERWDFDWQRFYFYEQPIALTAESVLDITCEWDSSGLSEPIRPGWGTRNEMCLVTMMLTRAL